jgi:hypothetical protein
MVKKRFSISHFNLKQTRAIFVLFFLFFASPGTKSTSAKIPGPGLKSPSYNEKQVIILKADDINFSYQCKRFIKYIEDKKIKASLGVVAKLLNDEPFCKWLISLSKKSNFEIWNHGLFHACNDQGISEFTGSPYEDQLIYLQESQKIFKNKLGVTCNTFGAPCNFIDENMSRALAEIQEIKMWYFGKTEGEKICLEHRGRIEFTVGYPNYDLFMKNYYQEQWDQCDYLVFQLHPLFWRDENWVEFEKIMDFLLQKGVVFMNPSEYYRQVTETIRVTNTDSSGPGSLRAAIDQANHTDRQGSIILLPAGTYYLNGIYGEDQNAGGDLDIAANIAIEGAGADSTIIDGNNNDRVFHIHEGKVSISGVTICHGRANRGGGLRVEEGIFIISDCIITENTVVDDEKEEAGGGGIYVRDAKVTITRCKITNNSGDSARGAKGGGVLVNHVNISSPVDIRNNLIQGNTANTNASGPGWGGGVFLLTGSSENEVMILNNTFRDNIAGKYARGEGGGLCLQEVGKASLERNRFIENIASEKGKGSGGGIFSQGKVNVSMTNNLLANNRATSAGGGIYLSGDSLAGQSKPIVCTMVNNTLVDNNRGNGAEGIYVGDYVTLDLVNNLVAGHSIGIYNSAAAGTGTITADTNLFYNNSDPVKGTNALVRDPLLTPGFKPMKNSPAVDTGKTTAGVTRDLEDTRRPLGKGCDMGCYEYLSDPEPIISMDRTLFYFGSSGSHVTAGQVLKISNTGTGPLNWTAKPNEVWVRVSPASGSGQGTAVINVDPTGLSPGTHTGTLSIIDAYAPNSPQIVKVNLTVCKPGSSGAPVGQFVTPGDGAAGVAGSIPLTGWALDDIQVSKLEIFLEQEKNLVFIGNAVFIEDIRPGVEQAYPAYPYNYKAGWDYMLLTNLLPNRGTGTFTLHAVATDKEGNRITLGTKTITCDNANAVKPFGSIDTPAQGGATSTFNFLNWGWVLTPPPNSIPRDGSTIDVMVDGVIIGHPHYNKPRDDIAALFPGCANSKRASGYFYLDTTLYRDGIHTIQWLVTDSAGNTEGIGSRYFLVQNDTASDHQYNPVNFSQKKSTPKILKSEDLKALPLDFHQPVWIKKGCRRNVKPEPIYPDDKGNIDIEIRELESVEIRFPGESSGIMGYLLTGSQPRPLPIGSTLDTQTGTFYWQAGPGFIGLHRLIFVLKGQKGEMKLKKINIKVLTKFF